MIHINKRQLSMGTHCYAPIIYRTYTRKKHNKKNTRKTSTKKKNGNVCPPQKMKL